MVVRLRLAWDASCVLVSRERARPLFSLVRNSVSAASRSASLPATCPSRPALVCALVFIFVQTHPDAHPFRDLEHVNTPSSVRRLP